MNLPFTQHAFLDAFARYNEAVWPAQIFLTGAAFAILIAIAQRWCQRDRIASGLLGALWLWSGTVYHMGFFTDVSPAGWIFGATFVFQGIGFLVHGVARREILFTPREHRGRWLAGLVAIGYALILYPMLARGFGHEWPRTPTFGAPCPLVLFTFGLLLWTDPLLPKWLLVVPIAWATIATQAALALAIHEDLPLPVVAIVAGIFLLGRPARRLVPPLS